MSIKPMQPSRRKFLISGTVAGVGTIAVGHLTMPSSVSAVQGNQKSIEFAIEDVLSSSELNQFRQLTATALTDPAFANLASSTLQNTTGLTSFQTSMLTAIGIITRDPSSLRTLLLGQKLTYEQEDSLAKIRVALLSNPAYRKLLYTAKSLRSSKNATLLNNYIIQDAANLSMTLRSPTSLGDATLDAIAQDIANIRLSTVGLKLAAGLAPILQRSDFIPFLKHQRASIIATFIPINVVISLLLPVDHDPPLSDTTRGILEALGASFATIAALLLLPLDLPIATLTVVLICIYGAEITGLILAFDDIFKGIDCDYDGDPNDPDDVPGIEC